MAQKTTSSLLRYERSSPPTVLRSPGFLPTSLAVLTMFCGLLSFTLSFQYWLSSGFRTPVFFSMRSHCIILSAFWLASYPFAMIPSWDSPAPSLSWTADPDIQQPGGPSCGCPTDTQRAGWSWKGKGKGKPQLPFWPVFLWVGTIALPILQASARAPSGPHITLGLSFPCMAFSSLRISPSLGCHPGPESAGTPIRIAAATSLISQTWLLFLPSSHTVIRDTWKAYIFLGSFPALLSVGSSVTFHPCWEDIQSAHVAPGLSPSQLHGLSSCPPSCFLLLPSWVQRLFSPLGLLPCSFSGYCFCSLC